MWKRLLSEWRRYLSYLLMVLAFGATFTIAVLGSGKKPPTLREIVVLTVVSAICQLAGAKLLNDVGRADPTLARSAVRTLKSMASSTQEARLTAEKARELKSAADLRAEIGKLSVYLSFLEEQCANSIKDWQEVHAKALEDEVGRVARSGTN